MLLTFSRLNMCGFAFQEGIGKGKQVQLSHYTEQHVTGAVAGDGVMCYPEGPLLIPTAVCRTCLKP